MSMKMLKFIHMYSVCPTWNAGLPNLNLILGSSSSDLRQQPNDLHGTAGMKHYPDVLYPWD